MQQCTFFMSISILISSVGFPRDSLVGFGIGGLPLPLIKSPPRWWMGVIVIEGLDYGSMSLWHWVNPRCERSLYFRCIFFFLLDTLPSYWQDLMPILYVARIMVGMFSTDVWHVNNMNLAKFSSALFWSVCAHAKRQQIQELHESSKWTRTEATVLHGLVESLVRQCCSAWWYQMLLLSPCHNAKELAACTTPRIVELDAEGQFTYCNIVL